MPTFQYKAARPNGTTVEAAIDGSDERAVRGQLERDGLIVLSLHGESKRFQKSGRFWW